jgi:hypothetical protein
VGPEAPHKNTRLPDYINLTLVEIIVYFPNAMRNPRVLLRLVQAGLDQQTLANIINLHRIWEKYPALGNTVCTIMQGTMRRGFPFPDWTFTRHKKDEYTYDYKWDVEDLTLTGVELECEINPKLDARGVVRKPVIEDIPFADLAAGVNIRPSYARGDGLMLSRCVQYAAANAHKDYRFPRDLAELVAKLDIGRVVRSEHLDAACVLRCKDKLHWAPADHPLIEDFSNVEDSDDEYEDDVDPLPRAPAAFMYPPQQGNYMPPYPAHPSILGAHGAFLQPQNPLLQPSNFGQPHPHPALALPSASARDAGGLQHSAWAGLAQWFNSAVPIVAVAAAAPTAYDIPSSDYLHWDPDDSSATPGILDDFAIEDVPDD